MSDVLLHMNPSGDVEVSLGGYLGSARFGPYRDAVSSCGGRYIASSKLNVLPVEQVPELMQRLKADGFTFSCGASLAGALAESARVASSLSSEGDARILAVREKLAARGLKMRPFQESGVRRLAPATSLLLGDEPGLGKTMQTLIALPEKAAALAIVPAAVLINWANEAAIWRPDLIVSLVRGGSGFRWPRAGELVIGTYGVMPDPEVGTVPAPVGTVLIFDEAHGLKNPKAKRTKAAHALRDSVILGSGKVWLLTGTPILNRPPELWAVLGAGHGLREKSFGSWPKFCAMFHGTKGRFGMKWGRVSEEAPLALQRVMLRRNRLEVLPELPPKERVTRLVNNLPAGALKVCDEAVEALRAKGIDITRLRPEQDLGALISGPVFEVMSRARAQLATAKIPAAIEFVEEYEEAEIPLVVASAHVEPVKAIGGRPGWAYIAGETSPDERAEIAKRFQAGELKGVAITFAAGGVGITLTYASQMLLVDMPWTPALVSQGEDRICRIGQTRGVLITRLVAHHPLDEHVTELITQKQRLIEQAVEAACTEAEHAHGDIAAPLVEAAAAALAASVPEAEASAKPVARKVYTAADIAIGCSESFGKFRAPATPVEVWAGSAILQLADHDPDRAAEQNGIGFNGTDSSFGHSIADALRSYGRLSDAQWSAAVRMVAKYHGQIGKAPEATREAASGE